MNRLFRVAPHPLTTSNVAWRQCRQKKVVRLPVGAENFPTTKKALSGHWGSDVFWWCGSSNCCSDCCASAKNILSNFHVGKWCTGFTCATFSWCFCNFWQLWLFQQAPYRGVATFGAAYERHIFGTLLFFKSWWDCGAAEFQGGSCAYHVHLCCAHVISYKDSNGCRQTSFATCMHGSSKLQHLLCLQTSRSDLFSEPSTREGTKWLHTSCFSFSSHPTPFVFSWLRLAALLRKPPSCCQLDVSDPPAVKRAAGWRWWRMTSRLRSAARSYTASCPRVSGLGVGLGWW